MAKRVFVFGSNTAGIMGAGAAKYAYEKKGAQWGKSYGQYGDSFAIPTKDRDIETLSLEVIEYFIHGFLAFAYTHPKLNFQVTAIGCGQIGLEQCTIAKYFTNAPSNCLFDQRWQKYLGDDYVYWGTYDK